MPQSRETKRRVALATLAALVFGPLSPALADDSDIFLLSYVDPNVVLLLDISSSMNDEIGGVDKIEIAKDALVELVQGVSGIRFGVFTFQGDGAELVAPVGTPTANLVPMIQAITTGSGTPLGKATEDLVTYYNGDWVACEDSGDGEDGDDGDSAANCHDCSDCRECVGNDCADCDCIENSGNNGYCDPPLGEIENGDCKDCTCASWSGNVGYDCDCTCPVPATGVNCYDCSDCRDCTGTTCNDCDCIENSGNDGYCDAPLGEVENGTCRDCSCDSWSSGVGYDCDCLCDLPRTTACYDCSDCRDCTGDQCNDCDCIENSGNDGYCDAPLGEIENGTCYNCDCDSWDDDVGYDCDCDCEDVNGSPTSVSGSSSGSSGSGSGALVACETPIESYCQRNFAIVTSDGEPSRDDYYDQVVDAATTLYTTDFSELEGVQNVIVHTIGFDNDDGRDLMTRAASAGGGNFYETNSADELVAALQAAVSTIVEDSFAFSAPTIPSTSVDGGDKAYYASFSPHVTRSFWNGHLKAYTKTAQGLIPLDGDGLPDESALVWDAGQQLADRSAATRVIYTVTGTTRRTFTTSTASITPALLGVSGTSEKNKLIEYIRGIDTYDEDANGDSTESRAWKLGDIYHSAPTLVHPPRMYSSDATYNTFRTANASRATIVLAGANDGMLHAFNEADGEELWAFIPPDSLDRLQLLPGTSGDHPFFADSTPLIADVKISGTWKTVAIFGMRRGGASYHALDITDTASPAYLWGFTDADMAETWSEPTISKIKLADGTEKWVAFVGGGFDTSNNNAHGAAVYAIDVATGAVLWKYSNTGAGDSQYMNFSIVSRPTAVDTDGDGYSNYVYVADIGGQIWKFNTTPAATLTSGKVDNWSGKRLFAADPSQANPPAAGAYYPAQGMYGSPTVALDGEGYRWVTVGAGDRNNPLQASANNFYAIKDSVGMTNGSTLTESDLVSALTTDPVTAGWYLPLAADEKVLDRAEIFDGIVYFTTFTAATTDVCEPAGSATLYAVKMAQGHAALDWGDLSHLGETDGTEARGKGIGSGVPLAPQVVLEGTNASLVVSTTAQEVVADSFTLPALKRVRYWREVF